MSIGFFVILGCVLGSFAASAAHAWEHGLPFWRTRSRCPQCGHVLSWRELIPLLSYCLQCGRCVACGRSISPVYSLVESLSGVWAGLLAWQGGATPLTLVHVVLAVLLVTASVIDIRTGLLPDVLTLGGLVLLVPAAVLLGGLSPATALWGAFLGALIPLGLYVLFLVLRGREGIGLGDVKLFALAGGICGWPALPFLFLCSSLMALMVFLLPAVRKEESIWMLRLPYGPFISLATLLALLFPHLPRLCLGLD